ncbi:MAG: hypothetical protein M3Q31_16465 [Actinomycetota bacterium]|nr:hypothetical protein [Actinomycetota bacterium]
MTSVLALAVIALLAAGEFLLFGALTEAYRDIAQLRHDTGTIDRLTPVDLGPALNGLPSAYGLDPSLDAASKALALFVDRKCGTCKIILRSLNGSLPLGVVLTMFADSHDEGEEWLSVNGFGHDRLAELPISIVTPGWSNPLGIDVTPLAIEIEHGRIARASTVPSARRFYSLVPSPYQLGKNHPDEQVVTHA